MADYLGEIFVMFFGFVAAFALLFFLTVCRCSGWLTAVFLFLAIGMIVVQGGCFFFPEYLGDTTLGQKAPALWWIFSLAYS